MNTSIMDHGPGTGSFNLYARRVERNYQMLNAGGGALEIAAIVCIA
jgi:hypothetical protein